MTLAGPVAPGVSATYKVISGPATFNGGLAGKVWKNQLSGRK